jgi:hypothetical protein
MSTRLYTFNFTPDEEAHIQDRILLARRDEREKCAMIAQTLILKQSWSPGYKRASAVIAKAIRKQAIGARRSPQERA